MATALAASITDALLGLTLASAGQDAGNRVTLEGLTSGATEDGGLQMRAQKLEAVSLRGTCGALTLEIGRLVLHDVAAMLRMEQGRLRLAALEAGRAEMSGVSAQGPAGAAAVHHAAAPWDLGPLADANGTLRAEIVDAHLLFDAFVSVHVRQGRVDFNEATVEHVGPDSRMGVSRLGMYVDAPNGRSYLYQFASPPIGAVQYERRGALLGPWVSDRGHLQLREFGESLMRQPGGGRFEGITEQARLLFDRTAVSGELRLGDGRLAMPGMQAELVGRAQGHNTLRLQAKAVGQGLSVEVPSLSVRCGAVAAKGMQLECNEVGGALKLRLFLEGSDLRFALDLQDIKLTGLRLHPAAG